MSARIWAGILWPVFLGAAFGMVADNTVDGIIGAILAAIALILKDATDD